MRAIEPLFPDQPDHVFEIAGERVMFPREGSLANRAHYLPAISKNYADVAGDAAWSFAGVNGPQLNYLEPGRLFHYPATLVSAGQFAKTPVMAARNTVVSQRNKGSTFTVADSGGFQIQEGTMPWEGEATVLRMLRWMEDNGDWVMALDFPTGGISPGNMIPHVQRMRAEGLGPQLDSLNAANRLGFEYNACLLQTLINTDYMLTHRDPGKAGFLTVLQGRNEAESSTWYRESASRITDGIAFAGGHVRHYGLMLNRILDMRADGTLQRLRHIHVLGTSTLDCAVMLTVIQRAIREHDKTDLQITYDTSNPSVTALRYNQAITSYGLDYVAASVSNDAPSQAHPDAYDRTLNEWCADLTHARNEDCRKSGRDRQYAAFTSVGNLVKVRDLLDFSGAVPKPISDAMLLVACHNIQVTVDAHRNAISNWYNSDQSRLRFPAALLKMEAVINTVLNPVLCPQPRPVIAESQHILTSLA
ncbi:hypothetical protein [Methylobacterium sp. NFXW15]|uniref:hypothetical protein n=1 Tax=Methylobacterium sp. NFXW15 TaxID=2819512 RepID=UPI003CF76376